MRRQPNHKLLLTRMQTVDIVPLGGWGLLEPVEEGEPGEQSDLIEIVKLEESPVRTGRIAFTAPWIEEMGLKVGDVVGFPKNMDYRPRSMARNTTALVPRTSYT